MGIIKSLGNLIFDKNIRELKAKVGTLVPLQDKNNVVTGDAWALGSFATHDPKLATSETLQKLKPFLQSENSSVKCGVIRALELLVMQNPKLATEGFDMLKPLLDDIVVDVPVNAASAMMDVFEANPMLATKETLEGLKPFLQSKNGSAKSDVIQVVISLVEKNKELATKETFDMLKPLLQNKGNDVNSLAIWALRSRIEQNPELAVNKKSSLKIEPCGASDASQVTELNHEEDDGLLGKGAPGSDSDL